ncbi:molybdenum cofactor biosynthesis protein MoaE [Methylolobus aquaticus]
MAEQRRSAGALATFIGTMRDFNEGDTVTRMTLEHYPGMTERQLAAIVETARARWQFIDALVIHRVGEVWPGDPIVLVGVWSSHRAAAFDACRYLMEELKSRAPFWKKETLGARERWVSCNTPGYSSCG